MLLSGGITLCRSNKHRENIMLYSIYIKSFTAAQKARNLLLQHNIQSSIMRTSNKTQGCGFALKITDKRADKAEVCALLKKIGVNCDIP